MAARIEDYALIGDLQTAALVSRDGSIDWLCVPRFDSGACFAALLGGPEHGRWKIEPLGEVRSRARRYRGQSLVLETDVETEDGAVRLIDFMPPRGEAPDVVRIVEGVRGRVELLSELVLRFDYGSVVPWVRRDGNGRRIAVAGPDAVLFQSPGETHGEDLRTVTRFSVEPGERAAFVMTWFASHEEVPKLAEPLADLDETVRFWESWVSDCTLGEEYGEAVARSLVVLKALTYEPTGGIVAAPTTSLPEHLGGVRNWDYRYCWLRDASLTLQALIGAQHVQEARRWRNWLLRAIAGNPGQIQILYGLAGERRLPEWEVDWLPGYERSAPVRIGNGACTQLQLDVYGELMDGLFRAREAGLPSEKNAWALQRKLLETLERMWRDPDEGIWEVRGPRRHFTHSKLMAWVAFDRAVRSVDEQGLDGPVEHWMDVREAIRRDVERNGWNDDVGAFVQYYGGDVLDASLLLMPLVGFLPVDDDRVRSTVRAIERELVRDGLVQRYPISDDVAEVDGLPPGEGTFLPCSFWLVECLALDGRVDEARALFERLLDLRNDLGLLAEEYDPQAGRLVGNFPQAFSHLALVNAALCLNRVEAGSRQRERAA